LAVSFSSTFSSTDKPNLFSQNLIGSSDYIDLEILKFNNGAYNSLEISNTHPFLTPVIEALIAKRDHVINDSQAESIINSYRNIDVRSDLLHLQQRPFSQDYSLNIGGGTTNMNYYLSGDYSKSIGASNGSNNRINLNASNTYKITNDFSITAGMAFTQQQEKTGNKFSATGVDFPPYIKLLDPNGSSLPYGGYRQSYIDTVGRGQLLDWHNYVATNNEFFHQSMTTTDFTAQASLQYKFLKDFSLNVNYQFEKQLLSNQQLEDQNYFGLRDLINQYTIVDPLTNEVTYNYPLGGQLITSDASTTANHLRGQLNFSHTWTNHVVNILAGTEMNSTEYDGGSENYFYGYNADPLTYASVDPNVYYPTLFGNVGNPFARLSLGPVNTTHLFSAFANASYSFKDKYLVSASGRRDAQNIFGVNTNNKWRPLWSFGFAWNIDKEQFFHSQIFNALKVRVTYGSAGNSPKQPALTIVSTGFNDPFTGAPTAAVLNYANPDLKWEQVKTLNFGIDFAITGNVLTGSLEYYRKKDNDLFGPSIIDPTAGVGTNIPLRNVASMKGNGIDITLNSNNLSGVVSWKTGFALYIQHNEVTAYYNTLTNNGSYVTNGSTISPIIGKPLFSIITYKWAGLDPINGQARVFLNGQPTSNYNDVSNDINLVDLDFHGTASPIVFGYLKNTFSWKGFNLSFNINYKFDYYFLKPSVNYSTIIGTELGSGVTQGSGDYSLRWQKPGDEQFTNIPAFTYPYDNSERLYRNSNVLIRRADNIRLQFANVGYTFLQKKFSFLPFNQLSLVANASNILILWKANKDGLDPDNLNGIKPPKIYSLSISTKF
jgi:hypothetical protein